MRVIFCVVVRRECYAVVYDIDLVFFVHIVMLNEFYAVLIGMIVIDVFIAFSFDFCAIPMYSMHKLLSRSKSDCLMLSCAFVD